MNNIFRLAIQVGPPLAWVEGARMSRTYLPSLLKIAAVFPGFSSSAGILDNINHLFIDLLRSKSITKNAGGFTAQRLLHFHSPAFCAVVANHFEVVVLRILSRRFRHRLIFPCSLYSGLRNVPVSQLPIPFNYSRSAA